MAKKKTAKLELTGLPNIKQDAFFRATGRHISYGGARGGGKSWALRRLFVMLALTYPGLRLLLLRRTLPELRENHVLPLLSELHGYAQYKDDDKAFVFPNGSRIKLGYCDAERDVLQYQGQEYDVIGLEEATHFTEYQMRFLTTCNRSTRADFSPVMYYTANPGGVGHQWFKRLFIDCVYEGKEKAGDYVFIQATVYDNTVLMENNPEYIDILENLPEDLRRAHLEGDWEAFAGQYFREWRRAIHVIQPFDIPSHWKRFRSLDYGIDMTACYWWAAAPDGKCIVYRELYQKGLNLTQAAKRIVDMSPIGEKIAYTVASPDLWNRRQETGFSGQEIMRKAGLTGLIKAKHDRVAGWRAMREFLEPYEDEQGIKVARLQFFDTCVNAIRTIPLLQHDENEPEDAADKPHEITHAPECLVGSSLVLTDKGEVPISEILPGNMVLTRDGFKRVLKSGITGINEPVFTAVFSNGKTVTATAKHPFWTSCDGFKTLDTMRYGDIIEVAENNEGAASICKKKSLSTKELSLRGIQIRQGVKQECIINQGPNTVNRALGDYIKKYGKTPTAKSQKVIMFITRIKTLLTMLLKTLIAYPVLTIFHFMGLGVVWNTWQKYVLLLQNGIAQKRAKILLKKIGPTRSESIWKIRFSENAICAARNIKHLFQREVNFAPILVNQNIEEGKKKTTCKGSVSCAEVYSTQTSTNQPKPAPPNVVQLVGIYPAGIATVYNLQVDGVPEFYANGVLVHNSIRYGVMSRPRPGEKPKKELEGVYHEGELRCMGYSARQIRRLGSKLKVLGGKKYG